MQVEPERLVERLPFDPQRVQARPTGKPARREAGTSEAMTVTQASALVRRVIAERIGERVAVVGEVSNLTDRRHWYLSLKDEQSVLHCVMWARHTRRCPFVPERGQQVVARGRFDYYATQGRLQLYVEELEPVGQGALELRFRQLCEQLRKEGYFADERKRLLPLFPEHIAVVTSATGAAVHDVVRTVRHRWACGCRARGRPRRSRERCGR